MICALSIIFAGMIKIKLAIFTLFLPGFFALASSFAPYAYRSPENPFYWKNRKPYAGYWQQDVKYKIEADINEETGIVSGKERLTYYNNSPDTLRFVFFHLYQNAFVKGSFLDALQKANKVKPVYGKYESEGLGTLIDSISTQGVSLVTLLDNTILKVMLDKPLFPNDSVNFDLQFKTYFDRGGTTRRRMKEYLVSGVSHYNGVHWYPRICVYDRKFGWETDQHLNREFYGDFGEFEVDLTFANDYVVEATGELLNREEVLPDSLREMLDVKNFQKKPFGEPPSVIIPRDGTRKTWKYRAVNVHDFAWTADPTYRIGEAEWNGIKCISLSRESRSSKWQTAASYAAKIIELYSQDFGMYAWPKIIVADAEDGMEYPMITLDGGSEPGFHGLFCHEIGHMWFFGMVGNNETYRASLDEGFTQFLTSWSMTKLDGPYGLRGKKKGYAGRFSDSISFRDRNYLSYLFDAVENKDPVLNTHSDHFNGALNHGGGYGHVYNKTATMLYNLQYVLGDELFQNAMRHYFNTWKMCHPYVEDFRASIIQYTKADLNWFFDQWFETSKSIDYKVKSVKLGEKENQYEILFKRKGTMQMPLDFTVFDKDEKSYSFHIPNTWFEKKTTATILPKWTGWDKLNPTYIAKVFVPNGIAEVQIDSTGRLADINMLNNSLKLPVNFSFDGGVRRQSDWKNYRLFARPDVWYNHFDGIKAGFNIKGDYLNTFHIFDFSYWMNTSFGNYGNAPLYSQENDPVSFRFTYETSTFKFIRNSSLYLKAMSLDGLNLYEARLTKHNQAGNWECFIGFKSMERKSKSDLIYLLYPGEWRSGVLNNQNLAGVKYKIRERHLKGFLSLSLKAPSFGSGYDFSFLTAEFQGKTRIWRLNFSTRVVGVQGTGRRFAKESMLFLAGANPEEMMENKFTRSRGWIDNSHLGYGLETNHFHAGGGLNLRGYAGYVGVEERGDGSFKTFYRGTDGAAINAELDFSRILPLDAKDLEQYIGFQPYLFFDAGVISIHAAGQKAAYTEPRMDAGGGFTLTVKKFGPLQTPKPFTLRFDFPVWLNRPPNLNDDYFQFRWVMGINKAF